jgi:hypothetical protein
MVPVWALAVVAVLMLGVGGAAGRSLSEPSDPAATSPTAAPPDAPAPSPSRAAIDEPSPAEDSVDAAVQLEVEPSTTTTTQASAPVTPDVAKAAVNWVFNRTRARLVEIIEQDPGVESVERLELDLDADVIRLDFTATLPNRGREGDTTWALVQRFAEPMFSPDSGSFSTELYTPGLAVATGGSSYACPSDTMIRLATFSASRTDFENEC